MKTIHQLLAMLLTSTLLLQPAVVAAAPIPDPNAEAGLRPEIDLTANGLPLVRITAPSADGVSRNQFRSFDIDRRGLIFNNARALTRTELAGYVAGNPNLAGGAARLILNEVTGSEPSALRGFAEIAGQRAELIIANPNGATCDGCGFINTSRATIAAGVPLFDSDGSFSGLRTGSGTLTIGVDGLQSEERVDLLARAMEINGAIHAGDLNLVTGVNQIGYPDLTIESRSDMNKPQLAIDVAALGGMYAGRIRLIGTEDGVGVVNNGTIAAGEDGLTLDNAGHLRLNGRVQSAGGGVITATGIAQSGVLYAADDLQLLSGGSLNNTGVIAAGDDLAISADHIATSGELAAGCGIDGRIGTAGRLSLNAADLVNDGSILFGDSLRATVNGTLDNRNGLITTSAAGRMVLEAQRIDNHGGLIDGGRVKISAHADIDNSGGKILATDLLSIRGTTATIDNSNGGLGAGQLLSLAVAALDNSNGLLAGDSALQLQSGTLTGSGRLLAGGRADITLSGDYFHPLDSLLQAAELRLTVAGQLDNAGTLTGQSLLLQVGGLDNLESGRMRAADLDLRAAGKILNQGRIEADRLLLTGDSVENRATLLGARLRLRSGTLDNLGPQAVIAATDSLEFDDDQLNNRDRASIFSLGDIRISGRDGNSPSERLLNEGSLIEADGDLSVSTVQLDNRRARVEVESELVSSEQRQLGLYQGYDLAEEVYDCFHGGDAADCGTWPEVNHYRDLRTVNIAVTDILEHDPERKFIRFLGPVSHIGQETVCSPDLETGGGCSTRDTLITETLPITAWYDNYSENNGQATLDYYPEYDPGRDIHPGREISVVLPAKGDLTVHNETARTVTTTVREDRFSLVSPQPRILAGSDMELRIGTGFDNLAGLVSAGEDLVVNGTSFKDDTTVAGISNRGFELHRVTREEKLSTVEWHDSCNFGTDPHCGNNVTTWSWPPSETVTVIDTLPGEILAGNRLSIFAGSLDNSPLPDSGHPLTGSTLGANLPSPADAADGTGPRLSLPQNSLFSIIPDPDRPYLVESDPRFTDYRQFLSSDYLLGRLGITPEETRKRLGDGFYEQRLVYDQLAAAPRPRSGNKSDGTARFRQLMDAGIAAAEELRLSPGIALSDEQVAALSHDIVWLVEQQVNLPDGGSETVWAPRVYLARLQPDDLQPDGALLAAGKVEIRTLDEFRNGGTAAAGEELRIAAGRADITGSLSSLADLRLRTGGDLRVHSGTIRGERVSLKSGGDLVIDTAADEIGSTGDSARSRSTLVGRRGRIESAGDLLLQSEGNLEINAAELDSGGRTRLESSGDLRLGTLTAGTETSSSGRRFSYRRQQRRQLTSQLKSGSDLQLLSAGRLETQGAELDAGGNLVLSADRGVRIDAVRDRNDTSRHVRGRRSGSDLEITDETIHGSRLAAGQSLLITSAATDADAVVIRGSSLQAGETGSLQLITPGGIRVNEARERHNFDYHDDQRTRSLFTRRARATDSSRHTDLAVGSDLSGGRVQLAAGEDLLVRGSAVAGSQVLLQAGRGPLTIDAAEETNSSKHTDADHRRLSSRSFLEESSRKTLVNTTITADDEVTLVTGRDGGDLNLVAAGVRSGGNIVLSAGSPEQGGDINILSGTSESRRRREQQEKGVGLRLRNNWLSLYQSAQDRDRNAGVHSEATRLEAGGTVTAVAGRDLNVVGSRIEAEKVDLASARDSNLLNDVNRTQQGHEHRERHFGINFSSDKDGLGFFAGDEKLRSGNEASREEVAPGTIRSRGDLSISAGGSFVQTGSDLNAGGSLRVRVGEQIRTLVAYNISDTRSFQETLRAGMGSRLQHGIGSAGQSLADIPGSSNLVTGASRSLRAIDAIDNARMPSLTTHLGVTREATRTTDHAARARASQLVAGQDLVMAATGDLSAEGTVAAAGRDLKISGDSLRWQVARSESSSNSRQYNSQAGLTVQGSATSASMGIGGNGSKSIYASRQTTADGGELFAGRDMRLTARKDLEMAGVAAEAEQDISLQAGHDLRITPATGTSSSRLDSKNSGGELGMGFGTTGAGPIFGLYASVNGGRETLDRNDQHSGNADIRAGNDIDIRVGNDALISGANLAAERVTADIGGDLTVASTIDRGHADGDRKNGSLTIGTGGIGFSAGFGDTDGHKSWVEKQTSIIGHDLVEIHVGEHTQLDGALVAADNGNLKLDTGSLGFSDIRGQDREKSRYLNLGTSLGGSGTDTGKSAGTTEKELDLGSWSTEGNYSNHNREQIVRATVGAGEIIVREDAEKGTDSADGLNRNTSQAYEITKDEGTSFEVYGSENSTNKARDLVLHPVKSGKQQWNGILAALNSYGRNASKAAKNYVELGEHAEGENGNKFAAEIADDVNMLLNTAGLWTGGLLAGGENHGGMLTQFPVLVTGDMEFYRAMALLKEHPKEARTVLESYGYEEFDPTDEKQVELLNNFTHHMAVNGMQNALSDAIRNGAMQTGAKTFVQAYNPEHGFIGDLVECAWDKTIGTVVLSGNARNLKDFYALAKKKKVNFNVASHSQGALLNYRALQNVKLNKDWHFQFFGAPVNAKDLKTAMKKSGVKNEGSFVNISNEPLLFGLVRKNDTVSTVLGGNAASAGEFFGGVVSAITLFGNNSDHSNYLCQGTFCANEQPAVEKLRPKLTNPKNLLP